MRGLAALRSISLSQPLTPQTTHVTRPALLMSSRGVASKLFVGESVTTSISGGFCSRKYSSVLPVLNKGHEEEMFILRCLLLLFNCQQFGLRSWSLLLHQDNLGLSFYTTEKVLSEAFSQFGQLIEAKIITDKVSVRSKGFGFVTFASEDEAEKALTEMNGKVLNGRVIFVDYAKARSHFDVVGPPIARGSPAKPPSED